MRGNLTKAGTWASLRGQAGEAKGWGEPRGFQLRGGGGMRGWGGEEGAARKSTTLVF